MSIRKRIGLRPLLLGVLIAIVCLVGCQGTNNDQGTSFLALGFFEDGTGAAGDSGTIVYLNEAVPGRQGVIPLFVPIDKDPDTPGIQGGFIGLENRIATQYIRTVRADCCYTIPGADAALSIPCDSYNVTTVLEPAAAGGTDEAGGETDSSSSAFIQFMIVSTDVIAYLNVNFGLLPELPYRMTAECSVTGISQAGDVYETNPVNYQIQFAEYPEATTGVGSEGGGGFQGGAGVGGDITTFGDAEPETVTTSSSTSTSSSSTSTSSSGSTVIAGDDVLARDLEDAELVELLDEVLE